MSEALVRAAERLEAVLLAENAALAALDFNGAMALLAEKEAAAQGFSAAQAAGGAVASLRARALELGHSLALLGESNRALLERAIAVQGRVIGMVTEAARQAVPPPGYGQRGRPAPAARAAAMALVARA